MGMSHSDKARLNAVAKLEDCRIKLNSNLLQG